MMDFSRSHCPTTTSSFFDSDSEEDDDFLSFGRGRVSPGLSFLSPSFGIKSSGVNYRGSSAEVCKNRNGRYDRISLFTKINKIIEENEKSILHAVEVASASVTQLESRTRRLENSMDDLKVCVEFNHGRTGRRLRELETILKEVHMDVKFMLDKQEIAETELHLLKLQHYRTEPQPETQNLDVQTTLPQQKPSLSSGKSYQPVSDSQPDSLLSSACANLPHLNHSPPNASVVPSISHTLLQNMFLYLNHGSEMPFSPPHESYYSNLVHPKANHQQFEPYANSLSYIQNSLQPNEFAWEQEQSTLHSLRVSDQSLIPANTKFVPPTSSFSGLHSPSTQNSYDDFASQYSSQVLPNSLPMATFLDTNESNSSGKVNKASNEEIVEEVIAMGFRRDMVLAALRKSTQKQESVDLNTLLDKLMI